MEDIMHRSYLYIDIKISAAITYIFRYHDIIYMRISRKVQTGEQPTIEEKENSTRQIVLVMNDMVKYNRVTELGDLVNYYSKLMSYYGFNVKTGEWNTSLFPVTQNDSQLEGIQLDIERYNTAARNYNKYAEYLAKELCINIFDETKKGHTIVFRPPPSQILTSA
jgi:hypothetical protein